MAASDTHLFERLQSYPFSSDAEFANGLSIILGHPETPASEAEMNRDDDLVLQAKCFFFSRKEQLSPAIDFAAFKSWVAGTAQVPETIETTQTSTESSKPTSPDDGNATNTEPVYPSSFAHIVELITTGQPIPGIQEIPDTVLTGHDIASEKPRRRKPWEKDEVVDTPEQTASAAP
ncbi:hypothetical protein N7541_008209 [Penicillium brevicompactum]|uniref:Uncharacterized protein n=1 Tax=Penicillium brevicompactum TaxID=5074 RepID=A0A9W9QYK2_PENBR|nr:uncharacterized protein N7506_003176 [Penicillium brevicompactum]KAJ5343352.1 hypothetical protein N7506_003176 [Penicillium brevicompactum]KAJ5350482.1 hypothetical protein N7541_008209 [Penicillium brevicompactum]